MKKIILMTLCALVFSFTSAKAIDKDSDNDLSDINILFLIWTAEDVEFFVPSINGAHDAAEDQGISMYMEFGDSDTAKTNDILETNSNPYYENTIGINFNYIPGVNQPSAMYGHQRMNRKNTNSNIDTLTFTIDSSLTFWDTTYTIQDLRVDLLRINNYHYFEFFLLNLWFRTLNRMIISREYILYY